MRCFSICKENASKGNKRAAFSKFPYAFISKPGAEAGNMPRVAAIMLRVTLLTSFPAAALFLKKCMNDPAKAKYLEENLKAIPDCVKSLVNHTKTMQGSPVCTYAAYIIDESLQFYCACCHIAVFCTFTVRFFCCACITCSIMDFPIRWRP